MKVSVIGSGYVGLVSAACLSEKGHEVICVDVDASKVKQIAAGVSPIYEPGLERLLRQHSGARLQATTDLTRAICESDLSLICVGTPFEAGQIDLGYIRSVSREIGEALRLRSDYHVVVVKSTVVPGTTEDVVLPILEASSGKKAGRDFGLGMNPEFLREGESVQDFLHPDRIVLGGIDDRTVQRMDDLYGVFEGAAVIRTTPRTAETIKYAANALFATMISFSNEIGNLCSALGEVDVVDVMQGVHLDKRLTPVLEEGRRIVPGFTTYLESGCGFGGSCFPKDVKALIAHGKEAGLSMDVLDAVIRVNQRQPLELLRILEEHFPSLEGVRIALLGIAFKPGTDDVRESPTIPVARALQARGATLKAYDPAARAEAEKHLSDCGITYCDELREALEGVDAIVLMTRWPEFLAIPEILAESEQQPLLVDGRRMLDKRKIARYEGIGL
jgi:UDPglucose 6-dehydrogenase/GDP-mannose 6-dehydrogenase